MMPNEPHVGIAFLVGGQVLIESTPLSKVKVSAGCQDHGGDHVRFWRELLAKRVVPPGSEYDDYPRGRIVYNVARERFVVMLDRCIRDHAEAITKIIESLHLPADRIEISTDSHYECPACESRCEAKRSQMLTIVGPGPKFTDSVVRREDAGPVRKSYDWQSSGELADSINERDPVRFPWGCYSKEKQETYLGLFLWFESLHEMLTYIAEVEPSRCLEVERDDPEAEEMTRRLVDIREHRLPLRRVSLADLKADLESVLGEYLSFHWIGTFADLCEGTGEFASDIVGQFLCDDGGETASQAVSPERRLEFIEFLRALT
jgi:hypothetical protein